MWVDTGNWLFVWKGWAEFYLMFSMSSSMKQAGPFARDEGEGVWQVLYVKW